MVAQQSKCSNPCGSGLSRYHLFLNSHYGIIPTFPLPHALAFQTNITPSHHGIHPHLQLLTLPLDMYNHQVSQRGGYHLSRDFFMATVKRGPSVLS